MAKHALTIGINDYPGSGADLAGCVNDARDWAQALGERGFETLTLLDSMATGQAIRQAIRVTLERARPGDLVVVTYSGHGTWVPDTNGDEPDRRDEALCPWDYQQDLITDDELFAVFTSARRTVRCVFISDSCHSGTVTRLAAPLFGDRGKVRFLPPEVVLSGERLERARTLPRLTRGRPRASALLLAGCADIEYSFDTSFNGRPNGAFSRVAIDCLRQLPSGATYRQWMAAVRRVLPSQDLPQTPQLYGGDHQKRWPVG